MRFFSTALLFLLFMAGCGVEEKDSAIPQARVNLRVTALADYAHLRSIGNYMDFSLGDGKLYPTNTYLGFGGLIVFRNFDGKIMCVDKSCPVERDRYVQVTMDHKLHATCKMCGSEYDLSWGLCVPISGPAKEPLKIYPHCVDNGTSITISN